MQVVVPYLTVSNAAAAIDWYKKAFEARENSRSATPDGKLMHADLTVYGGTVFVMDEFKKEGECGGNRAPTKENPSPVGLVIQLSAPKDVDVIYAHAVSVGAAKGQDPEDTFWGARFAYLTDPFGHTWMLNAQVSK